MKPSALALLTIVCVSTLCPADSSDDDKKHVKCYLRSCSSDEVSNTSKNTMRDKLGVRNGFRNRMSRQSPYQQRNCHEQERLWVEATIAQSSCDDITYYFNENLQNNFYSEHEFTVRNRLLFRSRS